MRQAAFIGVGAIVTLLVIIAISAGLDYGWKRSHPHQPLEVPVGR